MYVALANNVVYVALANNVMYVALATQHTERDEIGWWKEMLK